ncbi:CrcB family protein [Ornithinimicrobium avium]|uniref:Fluoride-specific ion channel FluC n=1 Tax=Ornithinimicrobium avium TaxID=2283195 RepID=A0A345NQQ2_9MICO|nr:CrcB family protein [Ornithinimicrobium avium]AXH97360.1 CrcB family protein [Ornithinimicrobium avium]
MTPADPQGLDPRPSHLRPSHLGLVLVGGTVGTGAREALTLALPPVDGVPWTVLGINVGGALLLGLLLDPLARRGPGSGGARTLRLLLGTGALGGFTTYSALATATATLVGDGRPATGLVYAAATLLLGALATWAGVALAAAGRGPSGRAVAR